jgi:hypothetical protein
MTWLEHHHPADGQDHDKHDHGDQMEPEENEEKRTL